MKPTHQKKSIRVAINGFGRIGRVFFRSVLEDPRIQIVAINEPAADASAAAHLLKYDSTHRTLSQRVEGTPSPSKKDDDGIGTLKVEDSEIEFSRKTDPARLGWRRLGVDVVLESTGLLDNRENAKKHRDAGAKLVLYSSTGKKPEDSDITLVYGVNHQQFEPEKHNIVANASCTTNCLACVCRALLDKIGILGGDMCTIHSYTADQKLWDAYHDDDPRRARAAARSIVPTSTGAAKAIGLVLPELAGKLDGVAYRVPTLDVSIVHLEVEVDRDTTKEEINAIFREAAESRYKGIVQYTDIPLVSEDYVGNPHSAIVDGKLTRVTRKRKVVIAAWYDNEWGYSCRLRDLILHIGTRSAWVEEEPLELAASRIGPSMHG